MVLFFAEKIVRSFRTAKAPHIILAKMAVFLHTGKYTLRFNASLINNVVSLEQPGPVYFRSN